MFSLCKLILKTRKFELNSEILFERKLLAPSGNISKLQTGPEILSWKPNEPSQLKLDPSWAQIGLITTSKFYLAGIWAQASRVSHLTSLLGQDEAKRAHGFVEAQAEIFSSVTS